MRLRKISLLLAPLALGLGLLTACGEDAQLKPLEGDSSVVLSPESYEPATAIEDHIKAYRYKQNSLDCYYDRLKTKNQDGSYRVSVRSCDYVAYYAAHLQTRTEEPRFQLYKGGKGKDTIYEAARVVAPSLDGPACSLLNPEKLALISLTCDPFSTVTDEIEVDQSLRVDETIYREAPLTCVSHSWTAEGKDTATIGTSCNFLKYYLSDTSLLTSDEEKGIHWIETGVKNEKGDPYLLPCVDAKWGRDCDWFLFYQTYPEFKIKPIELLKALDPRL